MLTQYFYGIVRRKSTNAITPAATATSANSSPYTVSTPISNEVTDAEMAAPIDNWPQNRAVLHGGGTVPSGLLQPPGRSSSAVMSVPKAGQPTKIAKADKPHPIPTAKCKTRVAAEAKAG